MHEGKIPNPEAERIKTQAESARKKAEQARELAAINSPVAGGGGTGSKGKQPKPDDRSKWTRAEWVKYELALAQKSG